MYTLTLENAEDSKRVGSKALNLARVIKAGLPVPRGFVLTSDAYARFISLDKLWDRVKGILEGLDPENIRELKQKSREIRSLILNSEIPDGMRREIKEAYDGLAVSREVKDAGGKALDFIRAGRGESFVAVRSSIVTDETSNSFAGQTFNMVNVIGSGSLFNSIKLCWAGLFSPDAIYYRKSRGISDFPLMAVVIQTMIDPEKSGTIFTADPATRDITRMVIEGSWGLGESIVSGIVNPDEYIISKETGEVLEKTVNKKLWQYTRDALTGKTIKERVTSSRVEANVLADNEIKQLWDLSKRVEETTGRPQDIEWSIARNRLYLLQARPITTLNRAPVQAPAEEIPESQAPLLNGITASPGFVRGNVRIIADSNELERVEPGDILVVKNANPDYTTLMKRVSGLVLDTGGRNSYMATISREFGLPCLVGTENATTILRDGQEIILDAMNGRIYQPVPQPETQIEPQLNALEKETQGSLVQENHPALGKSITATEVKLNLALPELDENTAKLCDGIGILRAERMLTSEGRNPFAMAKSNPEELVQLISSKIGGLAKLLYPKPVCYRSLDLSTEEARDLEGEDDTPREANPLLGWRGIRRSLDQPDIFKCEIEALKSLNQEGLNNIILLLPFISTLQEFRSVKSIIGFPLKLGIVIDTPSSALSIGDFCREGIIHASINLGSLAQLTLGVDRENPEISRLYSETNPAVLRLVRHIVSECKKHNVKVSVFSDANLSPELIEKLIGLGIRSISVDKAFLEGMKTDIARTERKLLLEKLRSP